MADQLRVAGLLEHAAKWHADTEIVSRLPEGGMHRYGYAAAHGRSKQLANALRSWAWPTATGWARWPGTPTGISSCTSACRALGRCATPSTRACFPSSSSTSSTTPQDRLLFFDLTFLPLVEQAGPACPTVEKWVLMAGRRAPARRLGPARPAQLRGTAGRRDRRLRVARLRRKHRLLALLHLRHHRPAQGRALLAPLHRAARARRLAARLLRLLGPRRDAARRAHVPRQRLGHAVRGAAQRAPSWCCPAPGWTRPACTSCLRAKALRSRPGCRPSGWAAATSCAKASAQFSTLRKHGRGRRLVPAGPDAGLRGGAGRDHSPRLGHDRNQPAGHRQHASKPATLDLSPTTAPSCAPSRAAPSSAST